MGLACRSILHIVRNIDTHTTLVPRYEPEAIYYPMLSRAVTRSIIPSHVVQSLLLKLEGGSAMEMGRSGKLQADRKGYTVLVGIDFSPCSAQALRYATSILGRRPGRILALHVIDRAFVEKCIHNHLGTEAHIKKTLFIHAKSKLKEFLEMEEMEERA